MYPRRMLFFVIAALLAVLVFGTIISNVQRDAWTQGYLMGQLAANAGDGKAAPVAPFAYPGYGTIGPYGAYGGPHFSGFGLLFLLGFGFLAFMAFNRHRMWRAWMSQQGQPGEPGAAAGGPWGGPWGRHGHRPPWWGWDSVPPSRGSETPAETGGNPANGESGQA